MKTTMKLTLDSLTRALRSRMHQMADEIESGYAETRRQREALPRDGRDIRTNDDDVSGD